MGLSEPTRARIWDATRAAAERLPIAQAYIHELRAQVAALTAERDAIEELRQQQHRAKQIVMDSQQREVITLREQGERLTAQVQRIHERARDGLDAAAAAYAAYQVRGVSRAYIEAMKALDAIVRQTATTPAPADAGPEG